jgi:predicted RNA polymerase sigma factor
MSRRHRLAHDRFPLRQAEGHSASPVVALNRAIAIGQGEGPLRGLQELHAIRNSERLASYPFYHAALGEFELRDGKNDAAVEHFIAALALARNPAERHFVEQRLRACECTVHAG